LAVHSNKPGQRGRGQRQVTENAHFISPIGGIDTTVPLSEGDTKICVYAYNMVPDELGLKVRNGYREWQVGLDQGANAGVHTLIPFEGQVEGSSEDRLFAITNEGIYDVTVAEAAPIFKLAFPTDAPDGGYGTYAHYLDSADNEFIFYADSLHGLYQYEQELDTWSAVTTEITGVNPALINFVVVHKQRVWFAERESTTGWYLPVGSRKGIADPFFFGAKFRHGGSISGLYNWTVDGGNGVDDILVCISGSGDVLPYQGSDPTLEDWSLVGTYWVGSMANGANSVSQYGGNLTLLSTFGMVQMSDLLRGVDPRMPDADSVGAKIASIIRTDMRQYRSDPGWDVKHLQSEGVMMITTPIRLNGQYLQYVYNINVGGWGIWRGVPITAIDTWENFVYFGTADGRVMVMDTSKDNILIDPPPNTVNGQVIEFSMLHSYTALGDPTIQKRGKLIRPDFLTTANLAYSAKFSYDFDVAEIPANNTVPKTGDGEWDVSLWDQAIWGSGELLHFDRITGGTGIGRYISVAIRGQALSGTILASTDICWDKGWFL
jgi:hypothetical protein